MKTYDKYTSEDDDFFFDESKHQKGVALRQDHELFTDDDNVPGNILRVRRKKGEFEIFKNKDLLFSIPDSKFTLKEKEFLTSANGMLFFIDYVKSGWVSMADLKRKIKEKV
jgi:hypothetical protein